MAQSDQFNLTLPKGLRNIREYYAPEYVVLLKSQSMPRLPSAIKMFKTLQAFNNYRVLVIEDFGLCTEFRCYANIPYDARSVMQYILFRFESEPLRNEFERTIIKEMSDYIDANPPPYIDEPPAEPKKTV